MDRDSKLRGRYYLAPIIAKLKLTNWTNEQISDLLDCSISTVKYVMKNSEDEQQTNELSKIFGQKDNEYLRVSAVHKCMEFLTSRGWQVGESDAKCIYDVFAIQGSRLIKIQVRSSSQFSARGFPTFKTCRTLSNTTRTIRESFKTGDFDYWFFYSANNDAWLIPFSEITAHSIVSTEGYDQFYIE